jgi:hypothetical protein
VLASSIVQFLRYAYNRGVENPLEQCARHSLLYNMSYRLDASAKTDRWIGFREWYRHGWKRNQGDAPVSIENQGPFQHLLITWNHLKDRAALDYVQDHSEKKVTHFLGKDCITLHHISDSTLNRFMWHCCALWIALRCFCISKQRPNFALMIRESIELAFIINFCKKNNIEQVSFFHPYEVDSNLIAIHCMNQGIQTQYIPSIIPLYVHNHHLVCDQLVVTSPYQLDEIKHQFSSSIFYKHLVYWSAESIGKHLSKNQAWSKQPTSTKSIAFYSHGQWLRNRLQRADNGLNLEDTEEKLLVVLSELVNELNLELTIFLHPLEKKNIALAQKHYAEKLKVNFQWGNTEERSAQSFQDFHWGIGAMSSVIFERLLLGYKTILFQSPGYIFPIKNSGLRNICFDQKQDIKTCWEDHETCSAEQFFQEKSLLEYYHFPEFK